jgi:hypothetical protein
VSRQLSLSEQGQGESNGCRVEELRVGLTCPLHSLYTESPMGGGAGRIDTVTPHANERRRHG